MRNKVIDVLIEMGRPTNIKGFDFIVEAMELFEDKDIRTGKTTWLYHLIAKKHDSTESRVERAIRYAFGIVITQGDLEVVNKYLTMNRTTNSNLLRTFYLRLTQEE